MATATKQLVTPIFEGQAIDRYRVKFSGSIELDPSDPDDLAIIQDLKLGRRVTLDVTADVDQRPHKANRDRAHFVKSITTGATLVVRAFDNVAVMGEAQRPPEQSETPDF